MAQVRFGVSLDEDVLKELDQFVLDNKKHNLILKADCTTKLRQFQRYISRQELRFLVN